MENNENLDKKLDETNNDNIDEINEESNELIETNKDLLNEEVEEAIDENELKIYELDLKMQELLISIEKIEYQYSPENYVELEENEEYQKLKQEYNDLAKEKKQLLKEIKSQDKSKLNEVSIWVIIYGIIMFIISFPIITASLWMDFAVWLLDVFSESFANLKTDGFIRDMVIFFVIFSLPLLINLITWLVHNNFVKTKTDRKVFIGFWIVQALMSVGMIIYMCTLLYGA